MSSSTPIRARDYSYPPSSNTPSFHRPPTSPIQSTPLQSSIDAAFDQIPTPTPSTPQPISRTAGANPAKNPNKSLFSNLITPIRTSIVQLGQSTPTAPTPSAPKFAEQLGSTPKERLYRENRDIAYGGSAGLSGNKGLVHGQQKKQDLLPVIPPGYSRAGFHDIDSSDLFRGAKEHPGAQDGFSKRVPGVGEDVGGVGVGVGVGVGAGLGMGLGNESALDVGSDSDSSSSSSSSSSGSSSSSSGLEVRRRVTQAVDFVEKRLGRRAARRRQRRGSHASTISTSSSSSSSSEPSQSAFSTGRSTERQRRKRSRPHKKGRSLVRTLSFVTRSSSPDRRSKSTGGGKRRKHRPTRREFTLMLPAPIGEEDLAEGGNIAPPPIAPALNNSSSVAFAAQVSPRLAASRGTVPGALAGVAGLGAAFMGIPALEDPGSANESFIAGSGMGLGLGLGGMADWQGRMITTPALPTVLSRIKQEREKSGYEEAFLREREVKERARERERRRRRGRHGHRRHHHHHHDHQRGSGHRSRNRQREVEVEEREERERGEGSNSGISRDASVGSDLGDMAKQAQGEGTKEYPAGLAGDIVKPTPRPLRSRASSWTSSLLNLPHTEKEEGDGTTLGLGRWGQRRSGGGRKRRAIVDLSSSVDPPSETSSQTPTTPNIPLGEEQPPTFPRRRSRLSKLKAEEGDMAGGSARRTSSLTDVAGLQRVVEGEATVPAIEALRSDIIRPKSASDLLGLGKESAPKAKKMPSFVLPPVPKPSLLRGGSVMPQSMLSTGLKVSTPDQPEDDGSPELNFQMHEKLRKQGCWWLDVSCPSWEDLRDLGELLHLHPLTLEDVLQQEPREKIDVYENLGYYFIVFRAIDETYFKYTAPDAGGNGGKRGGFLPKKKDGGATGGGKKSKLEIVENRPGKEGLEGVGVGGINVYMVVFADGVISFHFDDISKHIDRVREKISTLEPDSTTSEWIAHGLMDSIVDAFFPLITHIDGEVEEIDSLVIDPSVMPTKAENNKPGLQESALKATLGGNDGIELSDRSSQEKTNEKTWDSKPESKNSLLPFRKSWAKPSGAHLSHLSLFRIRLLIWKRKFLHSSYLRLPGKAAHEFAVFLGLDHFSRSNPNRDAAFRPVFDRTEMLRRMTDLKRLTTGLTRLLGSKYQVVTKLKKRAGEDNGEVAAYIGDVQDHILMLQTSLNHYEYILSHCHPAYVSHLRVSFSITRSSTSTLVLALSCVSVGVLPAQVFIGMFSMNVRIPTNLGPGDTAYREDGTLRPLNLFFIIMSVILLIAMGTLLLVRFWRWQAKQKSRKRGRLGQPRQSMNWWSRHWREVRFRWRSLLHSNNTL